MTNKCVNDTLYMYLFVDYYNKDFGIVPECAAIHQFFHVDLGGELGGHLCFGSNTRCSTHTCSLIIGPVPTTAISEKNERDTASVYIFTILCYPDEVM